MVAEKSTAGAFLPVRSEGALACDLITLASDTRPKQHGTVLGETLFQGAVRDAFMRARVRSEDRPGLRPLLRREDVGPSEAELLDALRDIREGRPPVSFGLGERLAGIWEQATQDVEVTIERLRQVVVFSARSETRVQEELPGQTTVSWTDDVDTMWRAALALERIPR